MSMARVNVASEGDELDAGIESVEDRDVSDAPVRHGIEPLSKLSAVLIPREAAALAACTRGNDARLSGAASCLFVSRDDDGKLRVTATDDCMLVSVVYPWLPVTDYPTLDGVIPRPFGTDELLIPAVAFVAAAKGCPKSYMPILANVHVSGIEGGNATTLATTDLETPRIMRVPRMASKFADWRRVMVKAEAAELGPASFITTGLLVLVKTLAATTGGRVVRIESRKYTTAEVERFGGGTKIESVPHPMILRMKGNVGEAVAIVMPANE